MSAARTAADDRRQPLVRVLNDLSSRQPFPTSGLPDFIHPNCLGLASVEHFSVWWDSLVAELCPFRIVSIEFSDGGYYGHAQLRDGDNDVWTAECFTGYDGRIINLFVGRQDDEVSTAVNAIFLNGASSSGKSCIACALGVVLPGVWIHFQPDAVAAMLPRKILRGEAWQRFENGVIASVRAYLEAGCKLIIDHVFRGEREMAAWRAALEEWTVVSVAVTCPVAQIELRERARKDRRPGLGARQAKFVHSGILYDVTVDTSALSALESARAILAQVQTRATQS